MSHKGHLNSWDEAGFANTILIDFMAWRSALENINCFPIWFWWTVFLLSNFTKANLQIFSQTLFKTVLIQKQKSKTFLRKYFCTFFFFNETIFLIYSFQL